MTVFTPIASKKNVDRYQEQFALIPPVAEQDLERILKGMGREPAFAFYFYVMDANDIEEISANVAGIFNHHRSSENLLVHIRQQKDIVEPLAILLLNLDYPPSFFQNPKDTELMRVLTDFLREEFKLTLLGLIYKATYDMNFSFEWSKKSQDAALKAKEILYELYL